MRFPAVLLARGARDDWYTDAKLQHDVAALERLGTAVTPVVFEGGHEWTHDLSARAAEFIRALPR